MLRRELEEACERRPVFDQRFSPEVLFEVDVRVRSKQRRAIAFCGGDDAWEVSEGEALDQVGVIGAGQMGSGIAHVCALAGYDVRLNDLSLERINAGLAVIERNLWRQAARGIITDVNKQMEALTGCTRDELIGAPFKDYFTDPERADGMMLICISRAAKGQQLTLDLLSQRRNSRCQPVFGSGMPSLVENSALLCVESPNDTTDRANSASVR